MKNKLSKLFNKTTNHKVSLRLDLVYHNDLVNLSTLHDETITEASSLEDKLNSISTITDDSALIYSNIIIAIRLPYDSNYIVEILRGLKYMNIESVNCGTYATIVLSGSIQSYKYLIKESLDQLNPIISDIKNILYISSYREFFTDIIPVCMRDSFIDPDFSTNPNTLNKLSMKDNSSIEIINIDPIDTISKDLRKRGLTLEQSMNMSSIVILAHNISEIAMSELLLCGGLVYHDISLNTGDIYIKFNYIDLIKLVSSSELDIFSDMKEAILKYTNIITGFERLEYYTTPRCMKSESEEYTQIPIISEWGNSYSSPDVGVLKDVVEEEVVYVPEEILESDVAKLYKAVSDEESYNSLPNRYSATRDESSDIKKDLSDKKDL